jgi:hypothetical protein
MKNVNMLMVLNIVIVDYPMITNWMKIAFRGKRRIKMQNQTPPKK